MRVLLTGTYSTTNKGDAAMELATATALRRSTPGHSVTISTPFAREDAATYSEFAVVQCNRRKLVLSTLQLIAAATWGLTHRTTGRSIDRLLFTDELRAYRDADLVVDLSGDMLTEDYGPHIAYSHFLPIILAILMRRDYVLCAQSIGPFKLTKPLAKFLLNRARWISVREDITFDYLRTLKVRTPVHRTSDMAFLLEPAAPEIANQVFADGGVDPEADRPLVGVSVSCLVEAAYEKARAEKGGDAFDTVVANALDRVIEERDVKLLFVPHVTGPVDSKDDRLVAERVRAKMRHRSQAITADLDPRVLKAVIGRCDLFVGCRMHANIGALGSGVPVVAMRYSHKTDGIMARFGSSERVLAGAALRSDDIAELVVKTLDDRDAVARTIEAVRAGIREDSMRNIELINALDGEVA